MSKDGLVYDYYKRGGGEGKHTRIEGKIVLFEQHNIMAPDYVVRWPRRIVRDGNRFFFQRSNTATAMIINRSRIDSPQSILYTFYSVDSAG